MGATRLVGQGEGGKCARCGAQLEADAMFCIVCGAPVTQAGSAPVGGGITGATAPQSARCVKCGAPLDADARFCILCGAEVKPVTGQVQATVQSCPNCGWNNDPDARYCIGCGILLPGVSGKGAPAPYASGQQRTVNIVDQGGAGAVPASSGNLMGAGNHGGWTPIPGVPVALVPVVPSQEDDDDATADPRLLFLTREEARTGCTKKIQVDSTTSIEVDVPAGVDVNTKLDAPGYGYFDEQTGQRGPIRLSFYID